MNKEIAMKWVEALRSGKYKQGKGALRDKDDNYCCLGVLCDVMDTSKVLAGSVYTYAGETAGILPTAVSKATGMKGRHGTLPNSLALYQLNDVKGLSFPEIADVIEARWEEL